MPTRLPPSGLQALREARALLAAAFDSHQARPLIQGVLAELDRSLTLLDPPAGSTPPPPSEEPHRRELERQLFSRGDQGLLDAVLNQSPQGIIISDPQGALILQNRAAEKIWAGSATADTVAGWGKYRAFHKDGRPYQATDWAMYRALTQLETTEAEELHFQRFDDSHGVLLGSAAPILGAGGKLIGAVSVFADITRQKDAEREARVSQAWLATTLKSIGDAVIATDPAGRVTFMNPVAEALTGWSLESAKSRSLREVFHILHESTRVQVENPVDKVLREGRTVGLASRTLLISRDGHQLSVDDSAAPIRDEHGELAGVVLVFRDVTEKRQEEDLRHFLVEASTLLAATLDPAETLKVIAGLAVPKIADWCAVDLGSDPLTSVQAVVAHVDPAKVKALERLSQRYPPDRHAKNGVPQVIRTGKPEFLSEIPAELLAAGARDAEHLALIQELGLTSYMVVPLLARGRVLGAITFVAAGSGRRYGPKDVAFAEELALSAALAMDNARLHLEQVQARKEAEVASQNHRTLAEAIPQQVWTATPDGALDFVNQRVLDYFAQPQAQVLGAGWQAVLHPEDLPACIERWTHSLRTGELYEIEFRLRRADGTYRWHLGRAVALRATDGTIVKWFGTNTDIDEQKRVREELRRRAEFEQQLVGIVSHDLRNPITAIKMGASTLLLRKDLDEKTAKVAQRVLTSSDRAERMIRDLLDFTQARLGGGIPIHRTPADFLAVAREVVEESQTAHPEREIRLEASGDGRGSWDADRLAQALGNLLGNAIHYGAPDAPVVVRVSGEPQELKLVVANKGPAIPPTLLPNLFHPLQRGESPTDSARRSIGLGLFIVKQIVDAHAGQVEVVSAPAVGTVFTVRLPRQEMR